MDGFTQYKNDVSRVFERKAIANELIAMGKKYGELNAIGEEMANGRDDEYVDYNSLVDALWLALWRLENTMSREEKNELEELTVRAELAKEIA